MKPLQWPPLFYQPVQLSWFQRLFAPDDRYRQVTEQLKRELKARPRPEPPTWGADPERVRIALLLCKKTQETYDWPNDHFIPEDPFEIIALLPWDDLDVVELAMALEEDLTIDIENFEVETWASITLGEVVDQLLKRKRNQSLSASK